MFNKVISAGQRFLRDDAIFSRVLANSGWLLSGNTISMGLKFLQGVVIARLLGVEQYGILTLVISYTTTINQFVDSRVWETAIKFVTQYRAEGDSARATATIKLCYIIDAVTACLAFLLIFLTANFAARIFIKDVSVANLIQFYASIFLISVPFGTSSALLRLEDRFNWLAYVNAGEAALKLIGVLVVIPLGGSTIEVLMVLLVGRLAGVITLLILSQSSVREARLSVWKAAPLSLLQGQYRRILGFTAYSNLSATSRIVTSRADALILGWFTSPSDVGIYNLAKVLSSPLGMLFSPVYTAIYPEMSKLVGAGKFQQIRKLQWKLSSSIAAIILPACLLLTVAVTWIIPIFFGEEYSQAVILTQIMIWTVVWTPFIWLPGLLLALERTRILTGLNWVDALNYLVLLFLLVPGLGTLGAAVATLLRFVGWILLGLGIIIHLKLVTQPQKHQASNQVGDLSGLPRN